MAGRPQGVKTFISATGADQLIVSGFEGSLYSIVLSWNNQTIGDRIVIYDSATNDNTKPKLFDFILPTAAGQFSPNLPSVGKQFVNGMYLNPQLTAITSDKIKIEVDYDGV